MKGFSVCVSHTHHRLSILFLYEKKKKKTVCFLDNLDINYTCNLLFTDKNDPVCIMKFYKYIYCLKSLNANTTSLHVLFGHSYSAIVLLQGCINTQLFFFFQYYGVVNTLT